MPGKITDELKRITRGQAGGVPDAPPPPAERTTRSSRATWLVALVVVLVAGGGWWLVRTLQADSKLQDCLMSGRKNCVETNP